MQANKKMILILPLSLLMTLLPSCSQPQGQVDVVSPSEPAKQQSNSVAKRFQETAPHGRTAVESAIEISQKYAELSEEAAGLRAEKQDLIAENRQLKEQLSVLDTKLKQTQKELTEANDLLIEMRIELNNWKTDILGFRDEIREAETAQLEALLKILKFLGGVATSESAQSENEGSAAVLSTESAQLKSEDTLKSE